MQDLVEEANGAIYLEVKRSEPGVRLHVVSVTEGFLLANASRVGGDEGARRDAHRALDGGPSFKQEGQFFLKQSNK